MRWCVGCPLVAGLGLHSHLNVHFYEFDRTGTLCFARSYMCVNRNRLTQTYFLVLFAQMTEAVVSVALVRLLVFAVGKMMHCKFKQCGIVIATGRTAVKPQPLVKLRLFLSFSFFSEGAVPTADWSVTNFITLSRLGSSFFLFSPGGKLW